MSGAVASGLVLALGSAGALNWGFLNQHQATSAMPPLSIRRPLASLRLLFSDRRWLVGFLVGLAGWALYIGALRLAPLSLVQATSAGGIGLLALLVIRTTKVSLSRSESAGVATAIGGLVLLGLTLGKGAEGGSGTVAAVAVWLGASLAAAAVAPFSLRGGAGLGVASGILYAAGDAATKAAVGGGVAVAFVAAVLVCHGLAFVALQLGFQRGGALATAGLSTMFTNALPIAAGMVVFHEPLPGGAAGVLRAAAFAAVVAGAALIAADSGPGRRRERVVERGGELRPPQRTVVPAGPEPEPVQQPKVA
jgi:hypothetical protein